MRHRYTAEVRFFPRLVVSLATLVTLVGSPSVAAACAALCVPGTGHEGHGAPSDPVPAPATVDATAHDHHHQEHIAVANVPVTGATSDRAVSDGSCCLHDDRALPALAAAVRFYADVAPAETDDVAPVLSRPASGHLTAPRDGPSPPSLAPGTPRVLRV